MDILAIPVFISEDRRKSVDFIQTGAKRQDVVVSGPGARARVLLGADYAELGRSYDALRELNLAVTLPANKASILYKAACLYCALGRKQEAIDALRKAWEAGFNDSSWVRCDSDLAILHDDPEFYRKMGLAPQKAITLGIRSILSARRILLVAKAAAKRKIMEKTLCGPVIPGVPASVR